MPWIRRPWSPHTHTARRHADGRATESRSGMDGSGYEEAEAELCRVEGDQVAVALGPPA